MAVRPDVSKYEIVKGTIGELLRDYATKITNGRSYLLTKKYLNIVDYMHHLEKNNIIYGGEISCGEKKSTATLFFLQPSRKVVIEAFPNGKVYYLGKPVDNHSGQTYNEYTGRWSWF